MIVTLTEAMITDLKTSKKDFQSTHGEDFIRIKKKGLSEWHLIGEPIAEGAYGTVYRSNQKIVITHEGEVTLRNNTDNVIKIQQRMDEISPDAFIENAIIEANQQWAQKVDTLEPILNGDLIFTVIEDCGPTLTSLLDDEPQNTLSFEDRLHIALSICSEMLLLNGNGVIHRDLKPDNICCKKMEKSNPPCYRVTFIDFGMAIKRVEGTETETIDWRGTPPYMDPALLNNIPHSPASDIYALSGIMGDLFGATDVIKDKREQIDKQEHMLGALDADYNFSGLCEGMYPAVDNPIQTELLHLLNAMQSRDPDMRPTIREVFDGMMSIAAKTISPIGYFLASMELETSLPTSKPKFDRLSQMYKQKSEWPNVSHLCIQALKLNNTSPERKSIEANVYQLTDLYSELTRILITDNRFKNTTNSGILAMQQILSSSNVNKLKQLENIFSIAIERDDPYALTRYFKNKLIEMKSFDHEHQVDEIVHFYKDLANIANIYKKDPFSPIIHQKTEDLKSTYQKKESSETRSQFSMR